MAQASKIGTTNNKDTDDASLGNTQIASIDAQENVADFPDGKNAEDYKGSDSWPCHRWAWEFLRRNHDFQKQCDEYKAKPTPDAKQDLKSRFGLVRYKHYGECYGTAKKQRPKFTTSNVVCWPNVSEKIYRKIKSNLPKALKPGQVLIRFDVTKLRVTEKSSIRAMLDDAKNYLERAGEIWRKEQGEESDSPRNGEDLLIFLRLLDLHRNSGGTLTPQQMLIIADETFATDIKSADSVNQPKVFPARKLTSAQGYRDSGYLHLAASKGLPRMREKKKIAPEKKTSKA